MRLFKFNPLMAIFLIVILLLVSAGQSAFALADVKNKATTSYQEDAYNVYWYGAISFSTSDSTNDIWTKAFWIGDNDLANRDGSIQVWGNAASGIDVNVYVEGSNSLYDASFVADRVDTLLDAVGSATPKLALLGKAAITTSGTTPVTDKSTRTEFLRMQFDGQAGNPATAVIYFIITIPKKPSKDYGGPVINPTNRLQSTVTTLPAYAKTGALNPQRD